MGVGNNISRTSGNVYNKIDKDSWLMYPKLEDVPRTSFIEVSKLALSDSKISSEVKAMNPLDILRAALKNN